MCEIIPGLGGKPIIDFLDDGNPKIQIIFEISSVLEYLYCDFAEEHGLSFIHEFMEGEIPSLNMRYNTLVTGVKDGVLKIVITDLASVIPIFVKNFNDDIRRAL